MDELISKRSVIEAIEQLRYERPDNFGQVHYNHALADAVIVVKRMLEPPRPFEGLTEAEEWRLMS